MLDDKAIEFKHGEFREEGLGGEAGFGRNCFKGDRFGAEEVEDLGLGFGEVAFGKLGGFEGYIEVFKNLIGVIDEGCAFADELVGASVVFEADASGDNVEGAVEVGGVGGSAKGSGGEGSFDNEKGVYESREDGVSFEKALFGSWGSDGVRADETAGFGDLFECVGVAWRLCDINSAGENADSWFANGEGPSVGGDIDAKGSATDDCASGESEMFGEFLSDGLALGGGATGADDADFRGMEDIGVAINEHCGRRFGGV